MASPLKKTLLSALLLPLWSTLAAAQDTFSFIPTSASSTFPECGLTCTALENAQDACVPPEAAVTNEQTYISCFCQSAYITSLKSSGTVCTSCTSASDQELLVSWYNGYCDGGYTSTLTATTAAATTSSTSSATTTDAATTTAATATSTSTSSADSSGSTKGNSGWFSTHWRWVVMLIVLAIGFTGLAFLGTWYKKRHDARQPGLYHGNDRNKTNGSDREGGPGPAAAFFSGSLRNLSRSNANSNNASTTNNSINNIVVGAKAARVQQQQQQQQPNMSTTSFSNPRSSLLSNNNPASISDNTANNHNNYMWGPHQATAHTRDFEDIAPVDSSAFRNSMAAAAAAAALDKTGSRTDVSRAATPRSHNNNPNRLSKMSVQSASTLQKQTSNSTLRRGPTPIRQHASASPVSPIRDD